MNPAESNPINNPNHPMVRCVDGTDTHGVWTCAYDSAQPVTAPYRVFDILNQRHVGPQFPFRWMANVYLWRIGGPNAPTRWQP